METSNITHLILEKAWYILAVIATLSGVISFHEQIARFFKRIFNHKFFKKITWTLSRKKIFVELKTYRKYYILSLPINEITMKKEIAKEVRDVIIKQFGGIEGNVRYGKNYIQIRPKGFNNYIEVEISPYIAPAAEITREVYSYVSSEEDKKKYSRILTEDENKEEVLGVVISIRLLGALVFLYTEKKDYTALIRTIDKIYERLEKKYTLKAAHAQYEVIAKIGNTTMKEKLMTYEREDEWTIKIGKGKVLINAKKLDPLWRLFDELVLQTPIT